MDTKSLLERLRQLVNDPENCGISDVEVAEVFLTVLPKLLAIVDINNLMIGASCPEAYNAYGERLVKALRELEPKAEAAPRFDPVVSGCASDAEVTDQVLEQEFTLIDAMCNLPLIYDNTVRLRARFKGDTKYGYRDVEFDEMTIRAGYWMAFVGYGELGKEGLQLHLVRMA